MESVLSCITECSADLLLIFGAVFIITYFLYRPGQNVSYSGVKLPPAMPSLPIVGSLPFLPIKVKDLVELGIGGNNKLTNSARLSRFVSDQSKQFSYTY